MFLNIRTIDKFFLQYKKQIGEFYSTDLDTEPNRWVNNTIHDLSMVYAYYNRYEILKFLFRIAKVVVPGLKMYV